MESVKIGVDGSPRYETRDQKEKKGFKFRTVATNRTHYDSFDRPERLT